MPRGGVVVRVWCGCALRTFDISLRDTSHMGHSFGATSFAIGSSHIGLRVRGLMSTAATSSALSVTGRPPASAPLLPNVERW